MTHNPEPELTELRQRPPERPDLQPLLAESRTIAAAGASRFDDMRELALKLQALEGADPPWIPVAITEREAEIISYALATAPLEKPGLAAEQDAPFSRDDEGDFMALADVFGRLP